MKGILFTEPLFRKVVSGEKTQTRRIIKKEFSEIHNENTSVMELKTRDGKFIQPGYRIGETVYLKEPYAFSALHDFVKEIYNDNEPILYKYSDYPKHIFVKNIWQNKLFMPERCARHFIEITGVRVERLQDISDGDCLKEGIVEQYWTEYPYTRFYVNLDTVCTLFYNPKESYADLIKKINGNGAWESNPYVFVYDFKLINK
jgi:hypothetical protein